MIGSHEAVAELAKSFVAAIYSTESLRGCRYQENTCVAKVAESCVWFRKSRRLPLRLGAVLLAALLMTSSAAAAEPNIVLILADDLAWSDLGCYGHRWHETPNLDRLADQGMRFTDAYAPAPICSASRASILTGKSPARLNFEFVTKNEPGRQELRPGQSLRTPPFTLNLPLEERTIAESLAGCDYSTGFFGKWHLNAHHGGYLGWSPTHGPPNQGFAEAVEDFGSHPYGIRRRTKKPERIDEPGVYLRDGVTERAVRFIARHDEEQTPFFLMVSHFYVHTPVETQGDWLIKKYDSRVPADSPNRDKRIRYAAFVETLDHYVGELLESIDAAGVRDETLVVFTSDNGGHPQYASNSPLRGSKWNLYEGGIRVPMIVRWPGETPAASVSSTPVIGYDLLPTFAEIGGYREKIADEGKFDGVSLAELFRDPEVQLERDLYWHFPYYHPERGYGKAIERIGVDDFEVSKTRPHSAIRRGQYKLLRFYERPRDELYDLGGDIGESHNLEGESEGIAERLGEALSGYLEDVDARMPQRIDR